MSADPAMGVAPVRPCQPDDIDVVNIGTENEYPLVMKTNDVERMRITAAGVATTFPVLGTATVSAVGAAAPAVAQCFGAVATEGLQIKVIDETISFAGNAALYKAMTTPIPAGAVILAVQANVQSALTGGSTTVKVGLGPNASDPDKYGKTSALTKNAKISTIPTHAVLASQEAIDVCACATGGGAGDTALTVGSVRVRIVYAVPTDLADA